MQNNISLLGNRVQRRTRVLKFYLFLPTENEVEQPAVNYPVVHAR